MKCEKKKKNVSKVKNKEVALLETFLRATTQKGTTGTTEGTMQSTKMSETSGP